MSLYINNNIDQNEIIEMYNKCISSEIENNFLDQVLLDENKRVEFKATLYYDLKEYYINPDNKNKNTGVLLNAVKAILSFLNSAGEKNTKNYTAMKRRDSFFPGQCLKKSLSAI